MFLIRSYGDDAWFYLAHSGYCHESASRSPWWLAGSRRHCCWREWPGHHRLDSFILDEFHFAAAPAPDVSFNRCSSLMALLRVVFSIIQFFEKWSSYSLTFSLSCVKLLNVVTDDRKHQIIFLAIRIWRDNIFNVVFNLTVVWKTEQNKPNVAGLHSNEWRNNSCYLLRDTIN